MSAGNQLPNLDKIFKDDDEFDFVPSSGSNLAAIFGINAKNQDSSSPIKHLSSKKIVKERDSSNSYYSIKAEVIIAKIIHAYKLQNGKYTSVGKLGIALAGNVLSKSYQIILYKSKEEYVSTVTVTSDFSYILQANNYSTYYDTNNENWSILFGSNEACIEFAREVGLARYFTRQKNLESAMYQNLTTGNKDIIAKEGSNVSIRYFIVMEIIQPFKDNNISLITTTVEISMVDNWERSLLGASKGLKMILFLPPSKQISLGPGFPKGKDIMMEVEIMDIRGSEDAYSLSKPTVTGKAAILSRMAKMGQSMLPKIPSASTTTDSEDTEDDVPQKSPRQKRVEPLEVSSQKQLLQEPSNTTSQNIHKAINSRIEVPLNNSTFHKPLVSTSTLTPQWSSPSMGSNYVTLDGQVYSLQPQTLTQAIPAVMDSTFNMILSETRMANAEIRMGMSKIADNMQKLLDKFHVLELQNTTISTKDGTMENALKLLAAIGGSQPEAKDNEVLKDAIIKKNTSNGNVLSTEAMSKITELERELRESKETLNKQVEHINILRQENDSLLQVNDKLNKNIQQLESSLKDSTELLKTTSMDFETTKQLANQCEKENIELEKRISKLTTERTTLELPENENKNKEIKYIMNKTYHTLMNIFTNESYNTEYIKSAIANTIKNITLQVLQEGIIKTEGTSVIKYLNDNISKNDEESQIPVTSSIQDEPPSSTMDNDLDIDFNNK